MVLPASDVETLIQLCWKIDQLDDVREVVNAAVPAVARADRTGPAKAGHYVTQTGISPAAADAERRASPRSAGG